MKYAFILFAIILFAQCKKKDVIITNPPVVTTTILGAWTNNESSEKKPAFTADSVSWNNEPKYAYRISNDTFYRYYSPAIASDPQFIFKINSTNDTLTLTHFVPPNSKSVYWRMK